MSTTKNNPGWKLSRRAAARVLNPLPVPTECPYCRSEVKAVGNEDIYGKPYGQWPYAYLCQNKDCRAYVGMHPKTSIPLGTLADGATRNARRRAKDLFHDHMHTCRMGRSEAYAWLAGRLGIAVSACHFGWFDATACHNVIQVIEADRNRLRTVGARREERALV